MVIATVAAGVALFWLRSMLIPFVVAGFIAIGLRPLISFQMRRLKLPRALAVITTLLLAFVLLGGMYMVVSNSVVELTANVKAYGERAGQLLDYAVDTLHLEKVGFDSDTLVDNSIALLQTGIVGTTRAVGNLLSQSVLVLLFVCFMVFGAGARTHTPGQMEGSIQLYITTKVVLSAITGILVGLILWLLGVDLALGFGLMTFLLNFIPSIGSIIATLLPLPMVLLVPESSPLTVLLVLVLPGTVQLVIGNVIEPRIMGKSFGLHPVAIIMALIFWGVLWGIPGMFLGTPLTAIAKVMLARDEFTSPAARLLEGRLDIDAGGGA